MYYNNMGFWGMGFFGVFLMIIFWGAFIWLIIWLINQNNKGNKDSKTTPKEALKNRLARGDITEKEYDRLSRKLDD